VEENSNINKFTHEYLSTEKGTHTINGK